MDAAGLSCILILLCTVICTAETNFKHSPQGFQGVRGKRSTIQNNALDQTHALVDNGASAQSSSSSASSAPIASHKNVDQKSDLRPLSLVKRAPMGFMGMRGKKDNEYDVGDFQDTTYPYPWYLANYLSKRIPSGFMGMRGRRYYDDADWNQIKRIPSGFLGMRGKKESDDLLNQLEDFYEAQEYDANLLNDLENERQLLNDFQQLAESLAIDQQQQQQFLYKPDDDKRAPSAGFFGMRGKKADFDDVDSNGMDKRAPSAGFIGMRGKKWFPGNNVDDTVDDYVAEPRAEMEKRAPMGFQGMRGKKDIADAMASGFSSSEEKRAPAMGFFGMRGKKGPVGPGFYGSRGKKGPFEFRGKFVGVRGKKIPPGSLRRLAADLDDFNMDDLHQPVVALVDDFESSKRGPSGFMGMRGKKWTETASDK